MTDFTLVTRIDDPLPSPAGLEPPSGRKPLRLGAVQCAWNPDPGAHKNTLATGIRLAASQGAQVICLQELTLAPYFAVTPDDRGAADAYIEDVEDGPTIEFAREMAAEVDSVVHASLYERDPDGLGFNTAIAVDPSGALLARTRKIHIPEFEFTRTDTSHRGTPDSPLLTWQALDLVSRPAGISGSRSSHGSTPSTARKSSCTRRPSGPNHTSTTSIPNLCGDR